MIDTEALRKKLIDLALRGELTEQFQSEGEASDYFDKANIALENVSSVPLEEVPHEIPSNWGWYYFADLVDFHLGKTPPRGDMSYWDNGIYPWVSIADIHYDGHIVATKEMVSQKACDDCFSKGISKVGTLIMSFKLTIGKVAILDIDSYHNEAIISILPKYDEKNIFRDYLFRILTMIAENTESHGAIKGNTLNKSSLSNMIIPLPPISEQKRIIDRLNEIFAQIETIDYLQAKYSNDLVVLKSKIIDAGIQGKLTEQIPEDGDAEDLYVQILNQKSQLIKEGKIKKEKPLPDIAADEIPFEIPKNWKWVRLGDISSKISSGNTPAGGKKSNAYVKEGYCFFREQNIYDDGIRDEGMVYISEELLNSRTNSTVLPKDILLNITGGSIGRCAIVPDDFSKGSINQHILIIRMIDERLRHYIHHCLCSPYMQRYIKGKSVGDKDGFSGGRCKNMLIPLPPINEQKRICEKTDLMLAQM